MTVEHGLMGWNYRVLKETHKNGRTTYAIHEVFYTKDGEVDGWTVDPAEAYGETLEELRNSLLIMSQALDYEVIELEPKPGHDGVIAS